MWIVRYVLLGLVCGCLLELWIDGGLEFMGAWLEPGASHSSPSPRPETPRPEDAALGRASLDQGAVALAAQAERQIAAGKLDAPDGDNALTTYRSLKARGEDALSARLGERLSAGFWRLGNEAAQRKQWREAARYFEELEGLPPVPTDAIIETNRDLGSIAAARHGQ